MSGTLPIDSVPEPGAGNSVRPFSTLISVDDLALHLNDPAWVVLDCRFTLSEPTAGRATFEKSRIPGAQYADLERELSGPRHTTSGRNPLPELACFSNTLAAWGIRPETQVVVYDDSFGSIAARLWWLMRLIGHQRVALLDGGWPVWKRKKAPIEEGLPIPRAVQVPPYPIAVDASRLADTSLVEKIRLDPAWALLDARPEERYSGERETVDSVAGHIPGSRHWTFEDNLGFDGRFLSVEELRENWTGLLEARSPDKVVHTCGSGVTACHNVLAMEHAGLLGSRLYAGSWSEWITDPNRPVATGMN